MKRVLPLALAAYTLAALSASYSPGGQGEKPRSEKVFAPKVLIIYCKDPGRGAMIMDVRVQQLGGRTFLVGKVARKAITGAAWERALHWVPIDEVVEMFEFNSIEEARKAQLEAAPKKEARQAPLHLTPLPAAEQRHGLNTPASARLCAAEGCPGARAAGGWFARCAVSLRAGSPPSPLQSLAGPGR